MSGISFYKATVYWHRDGYDHEVVLYTHADGAIPAERNFEEFISRQQYKDEDYRMNIQYILTSSLHTVVEAEHDWENWE